MAGIPRPNDNHSDTLRPIRVTIPEVYRREGIFNIRIPRRGIVWIGVAVLDSGDDDDDDDDGGDDGDGDGDDADADADGDGIGAQVKRTVNIASVL